MTNNRAPIPTRVDGHWVLIELLASVAQQAARDSGAQLVEIRLFPDCTDEFEARRMIVFEAVILASGDGRRHDAYWQAVEAALTCALPNLSQKERAFFERNVSFEVAEE